MPAAASDPLDSPDYDPINHLNLIFSHPSTLSSVSSVSSTLRAYQNDLDSDIAALVAAQTTSDAESVRRIQTAKAELAELFRKVETVRERAVYTEQSITEMTADIKKLDSTKRNLTLSMTALKRLQMLTTAYEQLRGLAKTRQYRECAQLLQAVVQLVAHFKSYRSIDQIATLSRNVSDLQRDLLEQVCEDFEVIFAKGEVAQRRGMLAEACLVMDALGEHARQRLVTWYCNTQLREYRQVFRGNDEAGSLDNISRRYSWFNRMLKTYDVEHAAIFPAHWRVNEMLANSFCEGTRDDFRGILLRSSRRSDGQTLDVNLLLSCLQETLEFEQSLEKKFLPSSRASIDTIVSRDDRPTTFGQVISTAFEPYMSLWVENQDKHLATMIPKYRAQPLRNAEEEFSAQGVAPSSTDMFHFYRLTLAQCAKLSTGSRFLELSKTFAKYLDQYSQQVLFHHLSERPGPAGPTVEDTILILNTADYCYVTCNQLEEKIKSRIDEEFRGSVDLQSQADTFMGIASAAVRSLVRRVELDTEHNWREMRNTPWAKLEHVGDQSSYITELVRVVRERAAEVLKLLHKQQYARAFCDNLVDALANLFVANLVACRPISEVGAEQMLLDSYALKKGLLELPTINDEPLPSNNTNSTQSPSVTPTLVQRPQPPAAYAKRVNAAFTRIDALLKTIQVRPQPPEALVQAYLIHVADTSDANFKKLLDLKGIRSRSEVSSLNDLFHAFRGSPSHANLPTQSAVLTPLQLSAPGAGIVAGVAGSGGSSGGSGGSVPASSLPANIAASLTGPASRFDPATFGSAIMSAARDGVDRLGTPGLGSSAANPQGGAAANNAAGANGTTTSATGTIGGLGIPGIGLGGSSAVSNQEGSSRSSMDLGAGEGRASNLNENLRNIGKFFRRDLGGGGGMSLGRFGRGSSPAPPEGGG